IAVHGRLGGEEGDEGLGVVCRDLVCVEVVRAQPLGDGVRARERPLHRNLLVQQHPDQRGQRTAPEEFIGFGLLSEVKGHVHVSSIAPCTSSRSPGAKPSTLAELHAHPSRQYPRACTRCFGTDSSLRTYAASERVVAVSEAIQTYVSAGSRSLRRSGRAARTWETSSAPEPRRGTVRSSWRDGSRRSGRPSRESYGISNHTVAGAEPAAPIRELSAGSDAGSPIAKTCEGAGSGHWKP